MAKNLFILIASVCFASSGNTVDLQCLTNTDTDRDYETEITCSGLA